jgi:RimJ/RimL family protein N-acetyltransferase
VKIVLEGCEIRSWLPTDAQAVARHANNRKIWRNLRDKFPHPYTIDDAREFLAHASSRSPETYFCIAVEGQAAGSIGYTLLDDVHRYCAEIGYWIAEAHWNRGIATQALKAVTRQAMQTHGLKRIFAAPFAWNQASARVLEKAGFVFEGRMRASAYKDGELVDQLMYAVTAPELPDQSL